MQIRDFNDVKEFFRDIRIPIIGIGVTAFTRLGPENFLPDYRIVCLSDGMDIDIIKKDVSILSIEREEGGKNLKRSKTSLSVLKDKRTECFLKGIKDPRLLLGKVNKSIENICERNRWKVIGNRLFIENKIYFRRILEELGIPAIPGEIASLPEKGYGDLERRYGNRVVVQLPGRSGGKGTFFVTSRKRFDKLKGRISGKVLITKFIKGPSPSIAGCVTRHGVLCTNLQHQLLDIPECINPRVGDGVFCGHDWNASIPKGIQKQAYEYTQKIGEYLKKSGYRGIFGLDMIMDEESEEIYVIECNPRMLGSFPPLTMAQIMNNEPPLIAFHILEFLDLDYDMDLNKVNGLLKKPKRGSQVVLFNRSDEIVEVRNPLRPGVYVFRDGELVYKREGYDMRGLKTGDEFVITDSVPFRGTLFRPHERMMRILALNSVMDERTYKLNERASMLVRKIYESLGIRPVASGYLESFV